MRALKTSLLSLSLFLSACGTLPQGSGRIVTETRTTAAFTKEKVSDGLTGSVRAGRTQSVKVEGHDNLLGYVATQVRAGELTVDLGGGNLADRNALHIDVELPVLDALTAEGAAQVDAPGLQGSSIALIASGGSIIEATGAAEKLTLDASGASYLLLSGLQAGEAIATGSGSSNLDLCATGRLELHLSGASHARYTCDPDSVTQDLTGSSTAREQ
jgi:hypothetical protein